uniref:Uncharacterized protein n=1 Tax=Arundo donax TaxID=35708 RepID=A0A0A9E203_ARUDO
MPLGSDFCINPVLMSNHLIGTLMLQNTSSTNKCSILAIQSCYISCFFQSILVTLPELLAGWQ